jgi:hypothetical protein
MAYSSEFWNFNGQTFFGILNKIKIKKKKKKKKAYN